MKSSIIALLLFVAFVANAQVKYEAGLGGFAAINQYRVSSFYSLGFTSNGSLVTVTPSVLFKLNINNKLGIITGFQYLNKGEKENIDFLFFGSSSGPTIKIHYNYFSIPLDISYNFLPKEKRLNAGIMAMADFSRLQRVAIHLPALIGFSSTLSDTTIIATGSDLDNFNRLNIAVGGGIFAGYNFSDHFNIMVYPFFKRDITNTEDTNPPMDNYFISYGVGLIALYRF